MENVAIYLSIYKFSKQLKNRQPNNQVDRKTDRQTSRQKNIQNFKKWLLKFFLNEKGRFFDAKNFKKLKNAAKKSVLW